MIKCFKVFVHNLLISTIFFFSNATGTSDSLLIYDATDSVLVIGNRYQVSMKNIASSYEVIPAEQIEYLNNHSALELVDIYYPSVFIKDKKIMGYGVGTQGAGQVYLRGQGGHPNTGVLVLLNGHPDFMGIFGHPLPDVYGMDDIQQVEILAGPGSTVYGSQAMGGVINIINQPNYKNLVQISAEGGKFDTYKLGLNLTKKLGNNGVFFTLRKNIPEGILIILPLILFTYRLAGIINSVRHGICPCREDMYPTILMIRREQLKPIFPDWELMLKLRALWEKSF
jgi:outer membrane cobalamin receptor